MKLNSKLKGAIIFLSGAAVGGLIGVLSTKKHYEKKYKEISNKEIAEMRDYVAELRKKDEQGLYSESLQYVAKEEQTEVKKAEESEIPKEAVDYHGVSEKWIKKKQETKEKVMEKLAENEHPEEDDPEEVYRESEMIRQAEFNAEQSGIPRVISQEEDDMLTGYSRDTLYYYIEDGTVVSDEEEVLSMEDVARLIGDCIEESDFDDNDETEIYVLNPSLRTIYEVSKLFGSYVEDSL